MRRAMVANTATHRMATAVTLDDAPVIPVATSRTGGMKVARTTSGNRRPVSVRCQSMASESRPAHRSRAMCGSSSVSSVPVEGWRAATATSVYCRRNSGSQNTPVEYALCRTSTSKLKSAANMVAMAAISHWW